MRLLEFQAKRIFAEYGITVPRAILILKGDQKAPIFAPIVLKAQVTAGGRGKAGAIKIIQDSKEIQPALENLFAMTVKDQLVCAVLAEEQVEIIRECYLAVLIDKRRYSPVVIASGQGGVEIEEVARTEPEKIVKTYIDPTIGLTDFSVRYIARGLAFEDWKSLKILLGQMLAIFEQKDATLVEINPLAVTPGGLVALDAKVVLDDKAGFRRAELFKQIKAEQKSISISQRTKTENLAAERDITYVPLCGEVGLISDGAGTGMLTIDLITDFGGRPADFCELGGLGNAERMCQAMEVILSDPCVKVLLITLIGGLTRMDDMAKGIVVYLKNHQTPLPLVVRMCGTQEEEGKEILREVGVGTYDDLAQAVKQAVELAGNN